MRVHSMRLKALRKCLLYTITETENAASNTIDEERAEKKKKTENIIAQLIVSFTRKSEPSSVEK